MIDHSDILLIYTKRAYGGAYEARKYAERIGKGIVYLRRTYRLELYCCCHYKRNRYPLTVGIHPNRNTRDQKKKKKADHFAVFSPVESEGTSPIF